MPNDPESTPTAPMCLFQIGAVYGVVLFHPVAPWKLLGDLGRLALLICVPASSCLPGFVTMTSQEELGPGAAQLPSPTEEAHPGSSSCSSLLGSGEEGARILRTKLHPFLGEWHFYLCVFNFCCITH